MEQMPDQGLMDRVEDLYEEGRYVSSWRLLENHAAPELWRQPKWQARAARIMSRVGGTQRSRKLVLRMWHGRESRAAARELMYWEMLQMRGPLRAWQWLQVHPPGPDSGEEEKTDFFAYRAYALAELRDFERAMTELDEAVRRAPEEAWYHTVRSHLLAKQDQHAEALEAAEQAMRLDACLISGAHATAEAHLALGSDDRALAVLREALSRLESCSIAANLVNLELELELYKEAAGTLDQYEALAVLMEQDFREWLYARRCDLACHIGDYDAAREWAGKITGGGFYQSIAARLGGIREGLKRRLLPVGFVRQHHLTCAPASLAMISRYWKRPVEHVAMAEEICHDGTPHHLERRWADEHGFATREFTVTPESARKLLDAGIPFTLSTVYPGGAHCQVVAGYDEFRNVLRICDPDHRSKHEFLMEEGLKSMAFCGPRGMAMAPHEESEALTEMSLPDADLYDGVHQTNLALVRHDRAHAAALVADIDARAPDHRLTWQAKWAVAAYDGDPAAGLAAVEALCRLHPDNVNWQMERIARMTGVRSTEERRAELRKLCEARGADPLLWRMLARELHSDARHVPEASRWLTKVLRVRKDAMGWVTFANLLWEERKRVEATELYRLASCWDNMNEGLAMTYFRAARWTKQTDAALSFLRNRMRRLGRTSGLPARTLHDALSDLDRWEEALETIEDSLKIRPEDADQMLFAARTAANFGRTQRATELLEAAKGKGRPSEWRRVSAEMLHRQCRPEEALAEWNEVVLVEPLAMDAHRAIARLHERVHGAQAALRYGKERCAQWPHYWPLHELMLEWAREDSPAAWEEASRCLVRLQPANAWARRELALALETRRDFDAAHAELDAAEAMEPRSAALHYIRGVLHRSTGRLAEARASFKRALEADVDYTAALEALVQCAETAEQRLESLKFVEGEIARETTNGDGISAFFDCARPYLAVASLRHFLEEAHRERPDLWQTWSALAAHLRNHNETDAAITLLNRAVERFPLMPRMWLELATAHGVKPDRTQQIEALEKVRELNPAWGLGMRTLAEAYDLAGRPEDSLAIMEQAVRSDPLDAANRGWLAQRQWAAGLHDEALRHVTEAVRLEPGYSWAWEQLTEWSAKLLRPELAREALNRLVAQRPMEPRTWLRVADSLSKREEFDDRIAALDKAISLNPHATPARDEKARVLGAAGRFDEALATCRAAVDGNPPPPELEVRVAWLLAQKGELESAITRMNDALTRDAGNVWGWQLLSDWQAEKGDLAKAEEAADQIARLRPNDPVPHGYIADLRLKRNDREGAISALTRSIELAPGYRFGAFTLFRLLRESHQLEKAEEVLNAIRSHIGTLHALARDFALAMAKSDLKAASTALRSMLDSSDDEPDAFELIYEELKRCSVARMKDFRDVAVQGLRGTARNPERGAIYVRLCQLLDRQPKQALLESLLRTDGIAAQRAYNQWLNTLGEQGWQDHVGNDRVRFWLGRWRVKRLIRKRGAWLREHLELWGMVSYALHSLRMPMATVTWLSDWRDRPGIQSWVLNNLMLALQQLGNRQEAEAVMRYALALPEHSRMTMRFHLWASIETALQNRESEARALLDGVDERQFDDYEKTLHAFLQVLLRYQPGAEPAPKLDHSGWEALSAFLQSGNRSKLLRQDFMRACRLVARRTKNPITRLKGWQIAHPLPFAILVVVAVFAAIWGGVLLHTWLGRS